MSVWHIHSMVKIYLKFNRELNYFLTDMRRDVQDIFRQTPHEKQCMMFSATLSKEIRPVCKKFMQDVIIPCRWDKKSEKKTRKILSTRS